MFLGVWLYVGDLKQYSKAEGKAEGEARGEVKGKLSMALKMLKDGLSYELVSKYFEFVLYFCNSTILFIIIRNFSLSRGCLLANYPHCYHE